MIFTIGKRVRLFKYSSFTLHKKYVQNITLVYTQYIQTLMIYGQRKSPRYKQLSLENGSWTVFSFVHMKSEDRERGSSDSKWDETHSKMSNRDPLIGCRSRWHMKKTKQTKNVCIQSLCVIVVMWSTTHSTFHSQWNVLSFL